MESGELFPATTLAGRHFDLTNYCIIFYNIIIDQIYQVSVAKFD